MGCTEEEIELMWEEFFEYWKEQSHDFLLEDVRKRIRRELPQYSVFLPNYFISKFPITNNEFHAFWKHGAYKEKRWWSESGWLWLNRSPEAEKNMNLTESRRRSGRTEPAFWNDTKLSIPNRPVVGVTWFEAIAYCTWLTEQLQLSEELPNGYVARLPTDAEWEKAARGTDGRFWPWGNEWEDNLANTHTINLSTTTSIGIFCSDSSPYDVVDMAGNVKEWCRSRWGEYPYDPTDGRENINSDDRRIARGGYWKRGKYASHCAYRRRYLPDTHHDGLGFRVVIGPKLD